MTDNSNFHTAVSQDGVHSTSFQLQFSNWCKCWAFNLQSADVALPTQYVAQAPGTAAVNVWTHLIGVYDAGAHTVALVRTGGEGFLSVLREKLHWGER